ncbi:UBP1-associated protein 2C [Hordeum vulgare]|nr:UBP1-associated protein 2C [Hordeum vulgare]
MTSSPILPPLWRLPHGSRLMSRAADNREPALRKIFARGLGWETNLDSLRDIFSAYGGFEESVFINDKTTFRSKGYGFAKPAPTKKHM